jgi:putative ABC transport system substrate-binding protein
MMSRRAFLATVSASLLAAPLVGAQAAGKVWRIGFLSNARSESRVEAFRQGLREVGYVEGTNVTIDLRSSAGQPERLPDLAAELVRLNVAVILAADPPSALAAKNTTGVIPIVMRGTEDPVGDGLVKSLARPGGNVTGLVSLTSELTGKRLELLKQTIPALRRVAMLWNPGAQGRVFGLKEAESAAATLGLRLQPLKIDTPQEFEGAFRQAVTGHADALIVLRSGLFVTHEARIATLAVQHRLPTMFDDAEFVEDGALMSYGANLPDLYRRAAGYVDRILKGAKPADLPVEQATKFELVINLKTAKALGLKLPSSVLGRADQVIE